MQSGGISEEDERDFQSYCDKYKYSESERNEYRFDIIHTSHYNTFCLLERLEDLKNAYKELLPWWLRWTIK